MSQYSNNALAKNNENTAWMQVLNLIEDKWTLLDIGCSSGNLGEELIKKKKCVVDGIEIDKKDAAIAKTKLRQVEVMNVEDHDDLSKIFKDKYDAILLIDVIEHLVDPIKTLTKLKDLLKPNGAIIFSIPNMAHASVRLSLLAGDFTYTKAGLLDETHLHFYTGNEVTRIFSGAGYKITKFNSSSLQYPEFLHKEKLSKLGLQLKDDNTFKNMLQETHGNVYQYVGSAQYVGGEHTKQPPVPVANPHEIDYKEQEEIFSGQEAHIKFLEKSLKLKDDHIVNLENIIEELSNKSIAKRVKRRLKPKKQ